MFYGEIKINLYLKLCFISPHISISIHSSLWVSHWRHCWEQFGSKAFLIWKNFSMLFYIPFETKRLTFDQDQFWHIIHSRELLRGICSVKKDVETDLSKSYALMSSVPNNCLICYSNFFCLIFMMLWFLNVLPFKIKFQ